MASELALGVKTDGQRFTESTNLDKSCEGAISAESRAAETSSAARKSAEVLCSVIYLLEPSAASFTKEINVTGDIFIGVKSGVNV